MALSTTLRTTLQLRLQSLKGVETSADQILALTAALDNLTTNRFNTVDLYSDLPNLTVTPMPSGSLVFVKQFSIVMMSVGTAWKGIESRTIATQRAYGWGPNVFANIGDGTTTGRTSPVTLAGGITNWANLAGGFYHSLGATSSGIAYSWGRNQYGQLGDNTTVSKSSPVTVVGGITTWKQMATGRYMSGGVTLTGLIYTWGRYEFGSLGDATGLNRSSPATIVGGITNWNQLSSGYRQSLAVTRLGIAWGWGNPQGYGVIGDGTTIARSSPVTVVGGITNWAKVTTGTRHTIGMRGSGVLYAWGRNTWGQLGDGTTTNRSSPVTVVGGITNWADSSAGASFGVGFTTAGIAYGWGLNNYGQIADGTTTSRLSPVTIVGGITNWSKIDGGWNNSFGITNAGTMYAWGKSSGIGNPSIVSNVSSPVTVAGGSSWTYLSGGQLDNGIAFAIASL